MARHRSNEIDFGSDSFLDIIANIVGILIILIVIAGLRAARAPVPVVVQRTEKKPTAKPKPIPIAIPKVIVAVDVPSPPLPDLLPPLPTPGPKLQHDLLPQIQRLRNRIAALSSTISQLNSRIRKTRTSTQSVSMSLSNMSTELRSRTSAGNRDRTMIAALKTESDRSQRRLTELRRQYDEAKRKKANVRTIKHRLTPIGRSVTGKEIHFRVAAGKVALVPVKRLVARMRAEVIRRKSWLVKFPTHKGIVGPVNGFEMHYSVQRQLSSTIDELRGGYGRIKIILQNWRIEPTRELEAETVDAALRTGSKFLQEIHVADSSATVTFWVYPDSFAAFRKLQAAVHRDGLRVAARPLPFGIPIAGSPRGSRSSGQ